MAVASAREKLALILLLLLAVAVWGGVLVLLLEVTRQILDVLRFIVDLGHLS